MKDAKQKAEALLDRYLRGECSDQEQKLVESTYNKIALDKKIKDRDLDFDRLAAGSWHNIVQNIRTDDQPKRLPIWRRVAAAAAVILAITATTLVISRINHSKDNNLSMARDIAPGTSGATLRLSNGRTIILDGKARGSIAEEAGVKISRTAGGQLIYQVQPSQSNKAISGTNTLSTDRAQTFQVILPDGTAVWLNAASSLTFPSSFAGLKSRSVKLSGEGYFEVRKDPRHPFTVESKTQKVEVLGTHFNLSSYADDEQISTTLIEGSVRLVSLQSNKSIILKPGEQSQSAAGQMIVSKVNTDEALAWKEGKFRFVDQPVTDIMKQIARWYNVEVVYKSNLSHLRLNASISRNRPLSQILEMMEKTNEIKFNVERRQIIVSE